jgi:integrase
MYGYEETDNLSESTVEDWAWVWYAHYKAPLGISDEYKKDVRRIIKNYILPIIGHMKIGDVRELHLQRVLLDCSGKSKSQLLKLRTVLKSMFDRAVKNSAIELTPADDLTLPSSKEGHYRSMVDEERAYFLQVANAVIPWRRLHDKEKLRHAGMFYKTMYYCGLRGGEVAALKTRNFDDRFLGFNVVSAIKKDGKPGKPKSKKGIRFVPIPEPFLTEIKLYITGLSPDDYIFTQPTTGNHHTYSSRRKMWQALKDEMCFLAGNPIGFRKTLVPLNAPLNAGEKPIYAIADDLTPHCLRHTFCTDALLAGVPIQVVAEIMGHEDIKTTKLYDSHPFAALQDATIKLAMYHKEKSNF